MKLKLEYVWLDGTQPEPRLRSKVKIIDFIPADGPLQFQVPDWSFDGSSTMQAEGISSDCYLSPIRIYQKSELRHGDTVYVLCEVFDSEQKPHSTNMRSRLGDQENDDIWFGFEQEYFIRQSHKGNLLGHENEYDVEPQGPYYCGVGGHIVGRDISDSHLDKCIEYGLQIVGTNAEVALGQWEYQIFSKGKLKAGDDLWISRYFLFKIAEQTGRQIELHPKPKLGWNGSGMHTNFSNSTMRYAGNRSYYDELFRTFGKRMNEHIAAYGSDNDKRLTGQYETAPIDRFSWGVSDRGASIRIPKPVSETWRGYLEDRRPSSNADPYRVIYEICQTLEETDKLFTLNYK